MGIRMSQVGRLIRLQKEMVEDLAACRARDVNPRDDFAYQKVLTAYNAAVRNSSKEEFECYIKLAAGV